MARFAGILCESAPFSSASAVPGSLHQGAERDATSIPSAREIRDHAFTADHAELPAPRDPRLVRQQRHRKSLKVNMPDRLPGFVEHRVFAESQRDRLEAGKQALIIPCVGEPQAGCLQ